MRQRSVVLAALLLGACVPATRDEPSLEEKCESLETYCVDIPPQRDDLEECHDIGARGVREPKHRDQCFVAYDECFDDCYFLYLERLDARDGG